MLWRFPCWTSPYLNQPHPPCRYWLPNGGNHRNRRKWNWALLCPGQWRTTLFRFHQITCCWLLCHSGRCVWAICLHGKNVQRCTSYQHLFLLRPLCPVLLPNGQTCWQIRLHVIVLSGIPYCGNRGWFLRVVRVHQPAWLGIHQTSVLPDRRIPV